jgi:hypothetical protein
MKPKNTNVQSIYMMRRESKLHVQSFCSHMICSLVIFEFVSCLVITKHYKYTYV